MLAASGLAVGALAGLVASAFHFALDAAERLLAALLANACLVGTPGYAALFALQVAFYGAALVALALDRVHVRPPGLFVPLYFCLINVAPLLALWMLLKGEKKIVWETGPQPVK